MPVIKKPNEHFDAKARAGAGGASVTVTGVNFQPDLVWTKSRNQAYDHMLADSVRGTTKALRSNLAAVELTADSWGYLNAFNSNGYTAVPGSANFNSYGTSSVTYIDWMWKAGGTAVTNNDGTITSQVSANQTAGFSIVAWTGNGVTAATVGHGLNAIPAMIICKERTGTDSWHIKHKSMATTVNGYFNGQNNIYTAAQVGDGMLGDLSSNTTFGFVTAGSPGNVVAVNENGITNIAYCWSEIDGYSKFGTYTGNGDSNGPFVYLGFKPKFIMVKVLSGSTGNWTIYDGGRNTYNFTDSYITASLTDEQFNGGSSYPGVDFLSNGFKIRTGSGSTVGTDINNSSTIAYAAFAETPFKYASAR